MPLHHYFADIVLLVHFVFILFVLGGGLLLIRWPRLVWVHVPAIVWGVLTEVTGWICPLTPFENYLRGLAGSGMYAGDFIQRYVSDLVYPAGLVPATQLLLAGIVIGLNAIIYTLVFRMRRKKQ